MNAKTNYRTWVAILAGGFIRRRVAKLVAATAILAEVFGRPAGLLAAEVTTDQMDYSPGATAIITGSGFAPGETVVLQVLHADGTESTGADHDPWSVLADADGAFTTSWHVCEDDCLGSTLQLTAIGQTSGEAAETFFTDAVFAVRLTNVQSVSGGCVRTQVTASSQVVLQAGQVYQLTYLLATNGAPPPCLASNPPTLSFVLGPNFGNVSFAAQRSGAAPGSLFYTNIFQVPSDAHDDTPITLFCDDGSTRQVLGLGSSATNAVRLVATLNCVAIRCPANVLAGASNGSSAVVFYPAPTVTGDPAPDVTCTPPSGSTFPVGPTFVRCTAVNSFDTNSCFFFVNVVNVARPPTISCPATVTGSASSNGSAVVFYPPFVVNGNPSPEVTCMPPTGSTFPLGDTTVTCTAVNSLGTNSCAFIVRVLTPQPPSLTCPSTVIGNSSNGSSAVVFYPAPAVSGNPAPVLTCAPPTGSMFPVGDTVVTCTAVNNVGTNSCSFILRVVNTQPPPPQPPSITCPPTITWIAPSNGTSAVVFYPAPMVSGNPAPLVTCTPVTGSTFPLGNTPVACTAVNSVGTNSCSFLVRVLAMQPPSITCPSNVIRFASSFCGAFVYYATPPATGSPPAPVFCTPPPGTGFPVGTFVVTCAATNSAGTDSCSFLIHVLDRQPPTITCPGDTTVQTAPDKCSKVVLFAVGASDNCSNATVTCTPPSGSSFPLGSTTVLCTAQDRFTNTARCSFFVTVVNSAPEITSLSGPSGPLALGSPASLTVNFTDADKHQIHTCLFEWDDGSSDTVSVGAGIGTATQTHTFAAAGVYTVTVTVSDPCTSASRKLEFIVIYDPNSSHITGGGRVQSPAGAYVADPSLTGRANFSFVSQYKVGESVPTGMTQFQLEGGQLDFRSTGYQWLVVAGPLAQYQGTGTVNGAGSYNFLLTARDGQAKGGDGIDKFRIKIWNADGVIYDNVLGASDDIDSANPQAIEAGNIVVHR